MTKKYLFRIATATATAGIVMVLASCKSDDKSEEPTPGNPSLVVTPGEPGDVSLTFTITPTDAEKVAYMVLGGEEEVPDAATLMKKGKRGTANKQREYKVYDLTPETVYTIAAVASSGEVFSEVEQISMTTTAKVMRPTVELAPGRTNMTTLTFTITASEAQKAAYKVVGQNDPVPTADEILSSGTEVKATETQVIKVQNLSAATTYVIAAAASHGEFKSAVQQLTMTTTATQVNDPYEILQGDWTATVEVYAMAGNSLDPSKTEEVTYDINISTGVNDFTRSLYATNNVLVGINYMDLDYYSPEDLMAKVDGYAGDADKANTDYGPKIFFFVTDEGDVKIVNGYQIANDASNPSMAFCMLNYYKIPVYYMAIVLNGQQVGYMSSGYSDVEISEDGNTVTLKGAEIEGKMHYLSFVGEDAAAQSLGYYGAYNDKVTTWAAGETVLRRKGGDAVAPRPRIMEPVPADCKFIPADMPAKSSTANARRAR